MAPIEKKRSQKDTPFESRKKQKAEQRNGGGLERGSSAATTALETLPWHEVPFPENFEDAEGFFGLEEISDVDVVRDSGKVEYKVRQRNNGTQTHDLVVDHSGGEDGWEGFEESEIGDPSSLKQTETLLGKAATESNVAPTNISKKERKKKLLQQGQGRTSGNTFDALGEDDEDEGDPGGGDMSAWYPLQLSPETVSSLAHLKFYRPTPIQASALPYVLGGHDAICKAPTGSGKTLAFGIPIYEHYIKTSKARGSSKPREKAEPKYSPIALILSPTRELAHQLADHLQHLGSSSDTPPKIATLTGGLSMHKQQRLLPNADIVIGTPGRLKEVMDGSPALAEALRDIRFLVLDEADRLLSSGHFQELEEILLALDRTKATDEGPGDETLKRSPTQERQTLVFSATFQKDLQQKLAGKSKSSGDDSGGQASMEYLLKRLNFREQKPRFIDINPVSQMATGLKEGIVECAGTEKDLYLYSLLLHYPHTRILIFTNSITSVRRLTPFLQNLALPAYPLHSQMPQKSRLRSIERFSNPASPSILIATDVAARGLDVPSVQLVVHYHLPRAADMYVHRSGRTARAEKSGSSILLCAPEEVQGVRRLIAKVHARKTSDSSEDSKKSFMRTMELDRRIVARVKPRVLLSKKIADAALANEKTRHEDNWLKTAAEDLGVDYDSEEFAAGEGSKKGRGQGRKKKEKEARELTKGDVGALRAELKGLLAQRVNVGVSERYLTAGGVDVDELLSGEARGEFLGRVDGGMNDL